MVQRVTRYREHVGRKVQHGDPVTVVERVRDVAGRRCPRTVYRHRAAPTQQLRDAADVVRMVVRDEDARQREAVCLQRQQNRRGITGIDHEGPFRACLE